MACTVTFQVDLPDFTCDHGEAVCIVGDCEQLGMWSHDKVVKMERQDDNSSVWTLDIGLPEGQKVQYRYAVCRFHELPVGARCVTVLVWEIHLKPRQFTPKGSKCIENSGKFGFVNGKERVDKGWLTKQTEVRLYFHNVGESDLITVFDSHGSLDSDGNDSHSEARYRFRVSAKTVRSSSPRNKRKKPHPTTSASSSADSTPATSPIKSPPPESRLPTSLTIAEGSPKKTNHSACLPVSVQVLNNSEYQPFHQGPYGHVFNDNDYMIFSVQTFQPDSLTFSIEVFEEDTEEKDEVVQPRRLGVAHLLPRKFKDSSGYVDVPIHDSSNEPVGELIVQYLVIRPLDTNAPAHDMSVSYARHWKRRHRPLNIGHRGSGRSHTDAADCAASDVENLPAWHLAAVKENTIASFQTAAIYGVDFIEFDVLLTKDLIPVVYHDFHIFLNMKKKRASETPELFEVPVSELTLKQLQFLKLSHASEAVQHHIQEHQDDDEINFDVHPFPTLRQVFEKVPEHIGFNVEIKYPQIYSTGVKEQHGSHFERNIYVDAILKVIQESAGARRVVFSSFCPDVCAMLRMKQNRYPVMFLNYGETKRYDSFMDQRCRCFSTATHWALSQRLLGMSTHTEDFLKERDLVSTVKNAGLIVFCWGDDNNNEQVINDLKELEVDAVIYDRIKDLEQSKENIFLVEARGNDQLMRTISSLSELEVAGAGSS